MQGPKNPNANLSNYGINNANEFWNLTSSELEKITLEQTQQIIALDSYPSGVYLIEMKGAARPIRL